MNQSLSETPVVVTSLESAALSRAAYDATRQMLWLTFQGGAVYCYFGVPPHIHQELITAPSKGKYLNRRIRGHFPYCQDPRPGLTPFLIPVLPDSVQK